MVIIITGFFIGSKRELESELIKNHLINEPKKFRDFIESCKPETEYIRQKYAENGFILKALIDKPVIRLMNDNVYYPFLWNLVYDGGGFNSHGFNIVVIQWYGCNIKTFVRFWIS